MAARETDVPITSGAANLATELRVQIRRLRRRLRSEANVGDLAPSQSAVISRLYHDGPATISMLARAEGMRPQSMGAIVASIQALGLLTATPDPADRRQTMLCLTNAYRKTIEAGRAARQDWLARSIAKHLTPHEQEHLATAIELLNRLTG